MTSSNATHRQRRSTPAFTVVHPGLPVPSCVGRPMRELCCVAMTPGTRNSSLFLQRPTPGCAIRKRRRCLSPCFWRRHSMPMPQWGCLGGPRRRLDRRLRVQGESPVLARPSGTTGAGHRPFSAPVDGQSRSNQDRQPPTSPDAYGDHRLVCRELSILPPAGAASHCRAHQSAARLSDLQPGHPRPVRSQSTWALRCPGATGGRGWSAGGPGRPHLSLGVLSGLVGELMSIACLLVIVSLRTRRTHGRGASRPPPADRCRRIPRCITEPLYCSAQRSGPPPPG